MNQTQDILQLMRKHFKPHPWHGIPLRPKPDSAYVHVFVEIVPNDTVKYELHKDTGYLSIDRPQKFSNYVPALYGFIPQTYCHDKVAAFAGEKSGLPGLHGDGDPLDICVLTERPITHGDIILQAKPIGGFRMIDQGEVDDKIIAVLKDDSIYGQLNSLDECPSNIVARLQHYFLTYKDIPGEGERSTKIAAVYGPEVAKQVIALSTLDYMANFGESLMP